MTAAPTEPGMVKVTTPQLLMSPNQHTSLTGTSPVITAVTNQRQYPAQSQSPVLIYVPVVQTATSAAAGTGDAHKTLQIHKSINGVSNGINGINCQALLSSGRQSLNSPRFIQADPTSVQNMSLTHPATTILKPQFLSSKYSDVLQVNSTPVVPATRTVIPSTCTVIQANGQPATVITAPSFLNGVYTSPTQLTTTTVNSPGLSVKLAPNICGDVKVSEKASSKLSTPTCIDISALTKLVRKTSSPPPLVQITPNIKLEDVQKSPIHVTPTPPSPPPPQSSVTILPQSIISEASAPAPSSTTQSILVQAPATAYTASQQQQQKLYFVTDGKNSQNCVLMPLPNSPASGIGEYSNSCSDKHECASVTGTNSYYV